MDTVRREHEAVCRGWPGTPFPSVSSPDRAACLLVGLAVVLVHLVGENAAEHRSQTSEKRRRETSRCYLVSRSPDLLISHLTHPFTGNFLPPFSAAAACACCYLMFGELRAVTGECGVASDRNVAARHDFSLIADSLV